MNRPLFPRCPQCGLRQKKLVKHMERCRRAAANIMPQPWRHPKAPSPATRPVVNRYVCGCAAALVTIDRHDGTTPLIERCRACGGAMRSSFYECDQTLEPTHEWRCPTEGEYRRAGSGLREHYDMGGLDLHEIEPSTTAGPATGSEGGT